MIAGGPSPSHEIPGWSDREEMQRTRMGRVEEADSVEAPWQWRNEPSDRQTDRLMNSFSTVRVSGDTWAMRLVHGRSDTFHLGGSQPEESAHQRGFGECAEVILVINASRCSWNIVGCSPEYQTSCHNGVGPVLLKNVRSASAGVQVDKTPFKMREICKLTRALWTSAFPGRQNTSSRDLPSKAVSHLLVGFFFQESANRIFSASQSY